MENERGSFGIYSRPRSVARHVLVLSQRERHARVTGTALPSVGLTDAMQAIAQGNLSGPDLLVRASKRDWRQGAKSERVPRWRSSGCERPRRGTRLKPPSPMETRRNKLADHVMQSLGASAASFIQTSGEVDQAAADVSGATQCCSESRDHWIGIRECDQHVICRKSRAPAVRR